MQIFIYNQIKVEYKIIIFLRILSYSFANLFLQFLTKLKGIFPTEFLAYGS